MPIQATCESCGGSYQVADTFAGKAARCRCGAIMTVPAAGAAVVVGRAEREGPRAGKIGIELARAEPRVGAPAREQQRHERGTPQS